MKCRVCKEKKEKCECNASDTIFYFVSCVGFCFYAFCFFALILGAIGAML